VGIWAWGWKEDLPSGGYNLSNNQQANKLTLRARHR
jgi:hypothetical protein